MVALGKSIRRLRFFVLESLILPLAMLPLRALMWTWRRHGLVPALLEEIADTPRVIFLITHGTLIDGLAFTALWRAYRRRWLVLTTPSLDGRFAVAMLARFDVGCAPLARGTRGADAAREFIARVAAGDIGVILVDGPRGPSHVVKEGVARTIAAARARVVVAGLAASPGIHLGSWDRTCIPLPLARVQTCFRLLPVLPAEQAYDTTALQAAMDAAHADAAQALRAGETRNRTEWSSTRSRRRNPAGEP